MTSRNDQVFAVSLSEIAFTLVLILMLLLGFMFLQEREARTVAEDRLRESVATQNMEATASLMEAARKSLADEFRKSDPKSPEVLINNLVQAGENRAELARARQEVADLTRKMVALEELRGLVEAGGRKSDDQLTRAEVESALALQSELKRLISERAKGASVGEGAAVERESASKMVERALTTTRVLHEQAKEKLRRQIRPGEEPAAIREIVAAAKESMRSEGAPLNPADLRVENEKLQTQLRFYEKRDKLRGLDHPPCWMDPESRIEYILNVQTVPEGFVVSRGWPAHREADANASEGYSVLMGSAGTAMNSVQFSSGAKPFLDFGKKQSPECRHFVYLSSTIPNADRRDEARRLVNSFFYILERKGPVNP